MMTYCMMLSFDWWCRGMRHQRDTGRTLISTFWRKRGASPTVGCHPKTRYPHQFTPDTLKKTPRRGPRRLSSGGNQSDSGPIRT